MLTPWPKERPALEPSEPRAAHLRVGLEDVVLDAALRAELLCTQQTAVLPHQVVPLQDTSAQRPDVGPQASPVGTRSPSPSQDHHLCRDRVGQPQLMWMGARRVGFRDPWEWEEAGTQGKGGSPL